MVETTTLTRLAIASTVLFLLASIACNSNRGFERLRSNEAVLKEDLYTLRNAIDQYTQDKAKAPQDLNDVVTAGYMKSLPRDPMINSTTTWQVVQEDVMQSIDQTQPGISDVHSGSNAMSTEGTAYSSW